ncbi:hypothetical protein AJ79_06365 [Helicocarpus griseus UAMH5409]|uniref:FAD-binding domain-containing protein n=1 Tax=Helicocarpus griseus UAMH5409 TaxID=1447875 RepID=A0A2B7XEJ7_9EURO|nr:hypothetical protein AJ79_06365 [Helicocarpus griseus UAMH5409]
MSTPSEPKSRSSIQLQVVIVGAGISGFAAAAALRQAGHKVKLLERSPHGRETGFSISIAPNGTKVLSSLGFDFKKGRGVECTGLEDRDAKTLEKRQELVIKDAVAMWGGRSQMILRSDIHRELKRVAFNQETSGLVPELILGANAVAVDIELGKVVLEDGTVHSGDVIIAADGEEVSLRYIYATLWVNEVRKSVVRNAIFKAPEQLRRARVGIFRSIVPTEVLQADPTTARLLASRKGRFSFFSDADNPILVLLWFEGRDGTLQDFEASYLDMSPDDLRRDADKASARERMLHKFRDFHPDLVKALEKTTGVTDWTINFLPPALTWTKGKAALIGDAAHSMFPSTGQGGSQALEDAGALGVLLSGMHSIAELPARLELYQSIRSKRVPTFQAMSRSVFGKEKWVEKKLYKYLPGGVPFQSPRALQDFTNSYDILADCRQALERAQNSDASAPVKAHL